MTFHNHVSEEYISHARNFNLSHCVSLFRAFFPPHKIINWKYFFGEECDVFSNTKYAIRDIFFPRNSPPLSQVWAVFNLQEWNVTNCQNMVVSVKNNLIYSLITIRLATCFDPTGSSSGLHYKPDNIIKLCMQLSNINWFTMKAWWWLCRVETCCQSKSN